ncbi:MAG: DNA primase [Deltaproteobacteria bacterium]|nr:DNA primase [Deltaproteobacteria bacterium]
MSIPKEKIDEVRERANIVQVISEYLPLTKRGQNHLGLCPFHSEKTPSFTVSETKGIYYCFGCNATGNVITFLMKRDGMSFPDAVRSLAKRYGITIPEVQRSGPDPRDLIYQALRASMEYFLRELKGPGGDEAREYIKRRGFEGEIAQRFNLGYAPDLWDGLSGFLRKKGIADASALSSGVVIKKEKGFYDRFRGRVIFPITDVRGRIVGFGGRSINGKDPKYLNSPESQVFKKGETLYGFYQAKQQMASAGAIFVEGYFDLLALHKHGFTNAVATMGTALTKEHLRLVKAYTNTVYALFDSDAAGRNASIRALDIAIDEEMDLRAVTLKGGKDPDEFLVKFGAEAMKEAIAKAEPLMEFFLKDLCGRLDLKTPAGKRKYLDSVVPMLSRIRNVAERGHYAAYVATVLNIPQESVYEALKIPRGTAEKSGRGTTDAVDPKGARLSELTVLKVMARHPELFSESVSVALESFSDPVLKKAGSIIAGSISQAKPLDAASLMDEADDEPTRTLIAGLLIKDDDGFIEDPARMLEDSLKRVMNKGNIKETTRRMIERLEEMGRTEVASDIRKRMSTGAKRRS